MRKQQKSIYRVCFFLLITAIVLAGRADARNMLDWRLVILPSLNFRDATHTQNAVDFMARMKDAGYNGMIFGGFPMRNLHTEKPTTMANLQKVLAAAAQNGISIIPMGQGQGLSPFTDKSFVETFPCVGTRFVVGDGVALPAGDSTVNITNGEFDVDLSGWSAPKPYFKIDTEVKHTGTASLRCDDPTRNYVRASQSVAVKPYVTYELSMVVKTSNIVTHNNRYGDKKCRDIKFIVQAGGVYLLSDRTFRNNLGANTNWRQVKDQFHSLHHSSVKISVQATQGNLYTGTAWFDNVKITEVGLQQTVIRENLPVTVKNASGATLTEGTDYAVGEEKLTIPAGSSLKPGDQLKVDWYRHAGGAAYCYYEVWNGIRQEIAFHDGVFGTSPARLMMYSEWRLAGWDPLCAQKYDITNIGSGKYMAATANITSSLYKEANGSRQSLIYNDAYDPYHNSKSSYYLVRGGCIGSGYDLGEDIIIMNWNATNRMASMKFFAGTDDTDRPGWGVKTTRQRQIMSSYAGPDAFKDWLGKLDTLEQAGKLPDGSVIGMAYHTYKAFPEYYNHVETMAETAEKTGRWTKGPIPYPQATPGIPSPHVSISGNPVTKSAATKTNLVITGANGTRSLRFAIPTNGNVRLSIRNVQGQVISRIMNEEAVPGSCERKIDVSKMAPGVYFATLTVHGQRMMRLARKMVVF